MQGLRRRCQHLKSCARAAGLGTKELLQMVCPLKEDEDEEEDEDEDEEGGGGDDDQHIVNSIMRNVDKARRNENRDACVRKEGEEEEEKVDLTLLEMGGGFETIPRVGETVGAKQSSEADPRPKQSSNALALLMSNAKTVFAKGGDGGRDGSKSGGSTSTHTSTNTSSRGRKKSSSAVGSRGDKGVAAVPSASEVAMKSVMKAEAPGDLKGLRIIGWEPPPPLTGGRGGGAWGRLGRGGGGGREGGGVGGRNAGREGGRQGGGGAGGGGGGGGRGMWGGRGGRGGGRYGGRRWSRPSSTTTETPPPCPQYKQVKKHPMQIPIIVDGFQYAHPKLSGCYFLTHFHSDHYIGLDKSFDCGRIYCSSTTAGLVRLRLRITGKI